jgi:hypothetical protein
MAKIEKHAIRFNDGSFVHMNPVKKSITDPINTTTDLAKAKMWEKEGMMLTWASKSYHKNMLDKKDPMWQAVGVQCEFTVLEP